MSHRNALQAALDFVGAGAHEPTPTGGWQVQVRAGFEDDGLFHCVLIGTEAEARARYEQERARIRGGTVRLYRPDGRFVRSCSVPDDWR